MGIRDFYFTRSEIGGVREHYFLRFPQVAHYGDNHVPDLLGSLSEKGVGGWTGGGWPKPTILTVQEHLIKALDARRDAVAKKLGVGADFPTVEKQDLSSVTIQRSRQHLIGGDLSGSVPSVPVKLSLGFESTAFRDLTIEWGEGTTLHYIPLGLLSGLRYAVGGDHREIIPAGLLGKHFVLHSLLISPNYTLRLRSERAFEADIRAKAKAINGQKAGVTYEFSKSDEMTVRVEGDTPYVIAVDGAKWSDLNMGI